MPERLSGPEGEFPKWRKRARSRVSKLPAELRDRARKDIAEKIERETFKRAFSQMAKKARVKKREAEERLYAAKVEALQEFRPGEDEEQILRWASRATVRRLGSAAKDREAARVRESFRLIRSGKNKGKYRRVETTFTKAGPREKKVGKPILAASLRSRVYRAGVRARLTALKNAFGLRTLKEAKELDLKLIEVPDRLRKRIYDKVVNELEREAAQEMLSRSLRGESRVPRDPSRRKKR